MNREQAIEECKRWLDHLDRQKAHGDAVMQIARDVREGKVTEKEARLRLRNLDNRGPTVFDGAKLADAVRFLIK